MKKFLVLIVIVASICIPLQSQVIKDGVLKSWTMAKGDIKIPDEVVEIAPNCFYQDDSDWGDEDGWYNTSSPVNSSLRSSNELITSIDFNNVKKIGKEAFKECSGIRWMKMPHVEEICEDAFANCDNDKLVELDMPEIRILGKNCFMSCVNLQTIHLGKNLTTIIGNPFGYCPSIKEFTIDNGANYVVREGVVLSKDLTKGQIVLPGYESVTFPNETIEFGDGMAKMVKTLVSVKAPSVKKIGENTFSTCSKLETVYLPKLEDVGFFSFLDVFGIKLLDIHESESFRGFKTNCGPRDEAALTIYVASEMIKNILLADYKNAKIVVGTPPSELKKYTINLSVDPSEAGRIKAWLKGSVYVENGEEVTANSELSLDCSCYYGYDIDYWTVNGKRYEGEEGNPRYLKYGAVTDNLDIVAHCHKLPEGFHVFYKSKNENWGSLTAVMDGQDFKSGNIVPRGKSITFTATPHKGFKVTDWLFEKEQGKYASDESLNGKTTWTTTPTKDLDIRVLFERMEGRVIISYKSLNNFGDLTAKVEGGEDISSYEAIPSGKTVVFTAHPKDGYKVGTWLINNEEQQSKENELRIENLTSDIAVSLVCVEDSYVGPSHEPVIKDGVLLKWNAVGYVTIPENVISIADYAFKGSDLIGLTISKNVEKIGRLPFMFCGKLKKLEVEKENKNFMSSENAVYSKDEKELVQVATAYPKEVFALPNSVETVRVGAFTFAQAIKRIEGENEYFETIDGMLIRKSDMAIIHYPSFIQERRKDEDPIKLPDNIKKIEEYAFAFNFDIRKLELPASLEEICDNAFDGCAELTNLNLKNCVALRKVGNSAFKATLSLESFETPSVGINEIGDEALSGSGIMHLNVPKDVKLGKNVFRGCQGIKSVKSFSVVPPILDADAFNDIAFINEAKLYVPKDTKDAYANAEGWKVFKNNITDNIDLSVGNVSESPVMFVVRGRNLEVSGIESATVVLYDLNGNIIYSGNSYGKTIISLPRMIDQFIVIVLTNKEQIIKKICL